jgi:oxygen-independent coproporphyrinogen III oxidase
LSKIVQWPIKHLSMYFLMVHENTPLYFKVQSKKVALPKDKTVVDLYYWSRELLISHGFKQYEVSNFAKEGYESHHNTVYWERKPYKAFGLGACSFDGQARFQNEKNLMKYLANIEQKKDITVFREDLTAVQVRLEKIMLGLRRATGISLQTIVEGLDDRHVNQVRHQLDELAQLQLIEEHNGNLLLMPAGLILENEIVARLSS